MIDPGIIDSKRLQMFFASVREGSFASAAQVLSVSPSAISHAMKALEEDLGSALFRRLGPQVKPTAAAMRMMPMVEDILLRLSAMKSELTRLDGRSGNLIFRLPISLTGLLRAGALSTFHECFPHAKLEMHLKGENSRGKEDLKFDFEIDYLSHFQDDFIRRDLMEEKFGAYAAPFHLLGQKSRVAISEIIQNLLIFPDDFTYELFRQLPIAGNAPNLRTWILRNPLAASDLAQQGQGIAVLPEWAVVKPLREGTLVKLVVPGFEIRRVCCAFWDVNRPLTWTAEVFLSLLAADIESQANLLRQSASFCDA